MEAAENACARPRARGARFARKGRTSGHRGSTGAVLLGDALSRRKPMLGWVQISLVESHRLGALAAERPAPWTWSPPARNPDASPFLAGAAVRETDVDALGASLALGVSPGIDVSLPASAASEPARCTSPRSRRSRDRRTGRSPPAGCSLGSRTAVHHAPRRLGPRVRWPSGAHRAET